MLTDFQPVAHGAWEAGILRLFSGTGRISEMVQKRRTASADFRTSRKTNARIALAFVFLT